MLTWEEAGREQQSSSTFTTLTSSAFKLVALVLLQVRSTSNIANGNKAWYYGDNDFIIQAFDFIARSNAVCVWHAVSDTDSCVTCSTSF